MYECFHCGCKRVIWDNDFDLDVVGEEGNGIVHYLHCENCGAEIQYIVREEEE